MRRAHRQKKVPLLARVIAIKIREMIILSLICILSFYLYPAPRLHR